MPPLHPVTSGADPAGRKPVVSLVALARVGALTVLAVLVLCWHYDLWTLKSWRLPTDYAGDALEMLARLQAAAEGDTWPLMPQVIERLGAPFGARWNAYPAPDKLLMLALGGLSRLIGLFAAANAGLLLAQVTSALAFYLVARWLRCRWEWAGAGALLFAYGYSMFHRGLAHFSFVFTWTVPLGLLAVWLVAGRRRLEWRSPGALLCLGMAGALGAHNPYNLFFWLQLMGWALLAQWFGPRRRSNLAIGAAAMTLGVLVFAATNIETWLYVEDTAAVPLLSRNYAGTEIYALKPVEMFIPPLFHRWDWLAFFGYRYQRWTDWRGEVFLPYLGLVGIAGLLWLGVETARRVFARRPLPGQALSVGWLLGFASIGGVTNVLAFFGGLQVFRATNRVVVYLSALVLFFLVVRLSRLTAAWPGWLRAGAALLVAGLGLVDQVPRRLSAPERQQIARAVESDQALGRALEAALPAGAAVFQLPVLGFPEVGPRVRLGEYDLFRPYLNTRTLRFSYGAAKLRARSRWQRDLENAAPAVLARQLERYGFAALYLNRKGYEDRADLILRELAALGYTRRIDGPEGNQVIVLLHPAAVPTLPLARVPTYGRGWHPRVGNGVRWAGADAAMSYFNPQTGPITVDLRLRLSAANARVLTLLHEGEKIGSIEAGPEARELRVPRLTLPPGVNRFELRSNQPAQRQGQGRYQLRSFGLHEASVRVISGASAPE